MDSQPSDPRRSAARDFMESLAELEAVLQTDEESRLSSSAHSPSSPESSAASTPPRASTASEPDFDWEVALGEAVQDIEQFMDAQDRQAET
jgi:hypothetical protein